jgi:flagellar biosynthesis/type III secretory pathway M-ring protein FliF/YscJ
LTASVMIDEKAVIAAAAGGDQAALRTELEAGVRAALGESSKRGDDIVVSFLPFAPPDTAAADAAAAEAAANAETWQRFVPAAVVAAAVLAAFFFLVRPLMAAVRTPAVVAKEIAVPVAGQADGAAEEDEGTVIHLDERLRARLARLDSHQASDVSDLVRQESVHSAEVLRRWIRN